jgi:hypothetical protein
MIVVILCAPRSGSSAVAQFFYDIGCRMYLTHDDEDVKEWGYERYEDSEMSEFGNAMSDLGDNEQVTELNKYKFRKLIEARIGIDLWGWKDPNTIWYIDKFYSILEEYDDVRYVWVKRDKRKAGESLKRMYDKIIGTTASKLRTHINVYELYQDKITKFLKKMGRPAFHIFYEGNYGNELCRKSNRSKSEKETQGIGIYGRDGLKILYPDA